MVFGEDDVDVLAVIYGPGRNLASVIANPNAAANTNGLWEAILRFSNAVIVDSSTSQKLETVSIVVPPQVQAKRTVAAPTPVGGSTPLEFGENDVDTALHILFAQILCAACFECMCNPPGGDWSGLSLTVEGEVYRWTSLPRVTAEGAKRPDHVIQFSSPRPTLLAIESKDKASDVEGGIGPRLSEYVSSIYLQLPNIARKAGATIWLPAASIMKFGVPPVVSAAAFQYRSLSELQSVKNSSKCDLVFGLEFRAGSGQTVIHVEANAKLDWLLALMNEGAAKLPGRLIIQIH
jgi:hypothetical protein